MAFTLGDSSTLIEADIDALACQFLKSSYADSNYIDWTLDRRLEGFLRRQGLDYLVENGDAYEMVLDRVMVRIGNAHRHSAAGPE